MSLLYINVVPELCAGLIVLVMHYYYACRRFHSTLRLSGEKWYQVVMEKIGKYRKIGKGFTYKNKAMCKECIACQM